MNAVLKHYQDLHLPLPCVWNVQLGDHSLSEVSEEVHKIALTSNGHCVGDRNSCAVCVCSLLQLCVLHLCVCTYVCTFGMYVRTYVRTYVYIRSVPFHHRSGLLRIVSDKLVVPCSAGRH